MNAVRQLAQAVLVLGLLGCVVRLLHATTSNTTDQHQEVGCDTEPIWVRDQQGGRVLPGGDVGGDRQASESFSVRFHHRDHPGVLVTYSYYAAVDEENLAFVARPGRLPDPVAPPPEVTGDDLAQVADQLLALHHRDAGAADADAAGPNRSPDSSGEPPQDDAP